MTQTAPIVFLDTETTSLHPFLRRPWEIGWIRRDPDGSETETLLQISDLTLADADPTALRIGGFYERYGRFTPGTRANQYGDVLLDAPAQWVTEAQAAAIIELDLAGAVVVGANPQFDTVTLEPLLRDHGLVGPWHYRPVCIEAIAYGYIRGFHQARGMAEPEIPIPWKSDRLGELLGVEPSTDAERHTALGDAKWVARVWDAIDESTCEMQR